MCWHCSQTQYPPSSHPTTACVALVLSPHLFVASYQVLLNPADGKEPPKLFWVCVAKFWWWEDTGNYFCGKLPEAYPNWPKIQYPNG